MLFCFWFGVLAHLYLHSFLYLKNSQVSLFFQWDQQQKNWFLYILKKSKWAGKSIHHDVLLWKFHPRTQIILSETRLWSSGGRRCPVKAWNLPKSHLWKSPFIVMKIIAKNTVWKFDFFTNECLFIIVSSLLKGPAISDIWDTSTCHIYFPNPILLPGTRQARNW